MKKLLEEEIQEALAPYLEHMDALGYVLDDDGEKVTIEEMEARITEQMLEQVKDQQIELGRIKKVKKEEEENPDPNAEKQEEQHSKLDDINVEEFFYIQVSFSVNCLYNPDNMLDAENGGTSDAFMDGVQKALDAEQSKRDKEQGKKN